MPVTLGPIIGAASRDARIWVKGEVDSQYSVRFGKPFSPINVSSFSTGIDGIGVGLLSGLTPNTEFNFDILGSDDAVAFSGGRFATFPDESEDVDFSFAFYSCHKPTAPTAMAMWDRLSGICHGSSKVNDPMSLRFVLPIGDQIYADELDKKSTEYLKYDDVGLDFHFDSRYTNFWAYRSIRDVFSRCPAYMIWDDHEIRDGWASRKNDLSSPPLSRVYRAAERAFIRHQLLHNPFCPNPQASKYYSFRFAKAGFIVADLRGERNYKTKTIMSPTQWQWLSSTLWEYSAKCKQVFVVLSVPYFHPVRGLAKALVDILDLVSKDEMEDSWMSKRWHDEGVKLAKLLFDVKGAPGKHGDIYLLSGDAHIATGAEIRLGSDISSIRIPQFTSSAISNAAPGVLKKMKKNIQSPVWKRVYDGAPYEGRMPHFVAARNFGVVRVLKDNEGKQTVRFDLQHEKDDRHVTLFSDGSLGSPITVT